MNDLEELFEHAPEGATEIVLCPDGDMRYATKDSVYNADNSDLSFDRSNRWKTITTRPQPELRKTVEDAVEFFKEWPEELDFICLWNDRLGDYEFWGKGYTSVSYCYEVCNYEQFEACVASKTRKTVEDVVEWNESVGLGDEWGHEDCDVIIIYRDGFAYSDSRATSKEISCTREEFEACVAAKAKSEHEWTHVLNSGARCKFFKSLEWMQGDVYESEDGKFFIPQRTGKSYSIKPIKPTISKDEKAQLELYVQYRIDKYGDYETKKDLLDYLSHHTITD
jgi:hypothetical protein